MNTTKTLRPVTPITRRARREAMEANQAAQQHNGDLDPGYVCKRCFGAAPIGVGYTSYAISARAASRKVTQCACGYSVDPIAHAAELAR